MSQNNHIIIRIQLMMELKLDCEQEVLFPYRVFAYIKLSNSACFHSLLYPLEAFVARRAMESSEDWKPRLT